MVAPGTFDQGGPSLAPWCARAARPVAGHLPSPSASGLVLRLVPRLVLRGALAFAAFPLVEAPTMRHGQRTVRVGAQVAVGWCSVRLRHVGGMGDKGLP